MAPNDAHKRPKDRGWQVGERPAQDELAGAAAERPMLGAKRLTAVGLPTTGKSGSVRAEDSGRLFDALEKENLDAAEGCAQVLWERQCYLAPVCTLPWYRSVTPSLPG
jgi:hypothetical protein